MESTSITYTLSEAEFIRAARAYWAYEAIGDRSNIIVAILCASAGPVLLSYGQNVGWAFLFFAVFFLALTAARNWIWRSSYRKMIKYRDDISVSFEQDKLDVRSAEGASSLLWTQFKSYAETPDYFFLIGPRRALSIVPKSAMGTAEILEQTRSFIETNLPRKKMRWT